MTSVSDTSILRKTRMTWKDFGAMVAVIVLLSGVVMSIVGWIHAEVTIPKILNRTAEQIRLQIIEHSKNPHPVSASRREFEMLKTSIEDGMDDFKEDTRSRLTRIEQKVDRL